MVKHVSFHEYGGWNIHGLRAFQQDSPPITFLSLDKATLLQPTPYMVRDGRIHEDGRPSRTMGLVHPGHYRLVGAREIRWPPEDHDGAVTDCQLPPHCRACAQLAGRGSPLTRYLPMPLTVRCSDCMSDASKRLTFSPALDHNGEEDELDTCSGEHTDGSCHYGLYATKANVRCFMPIILSDIQDLTPFWMVDSIQNTLCASIFDCSWCIHLQTWQGILPAGLVPAWTGLSGGTRSLALTISRYYTTTLITLHSFTTHSFDGHTRFSHTRLSKFQGCLAAGPWNSRSLLQRSLPNVLYPTFTTQRSLPNVHYPTFSTRRSLPDVLYPTFFTLLLLQPSSVFFGREPATYAHYLTFVIHNVHYPHSLHQTYFGYTYCLNSFTLSISLPLVSVQGS